MSTKKNLVLKATPEKEDFAHKYTEEGSGKIGARLLKGYFLSVEDLVKRAGLSKRKKPKAIELGCGEGFSTEKIHKFLPQSAEFTASEYVKYLVPRAQKKNPKIKVIQESVYELKHKNDTFDLVFLLEVLEHLDYPDKALKEIKRVTKPEGYIVVGVPREPLWRALNMIRLKYLKDFGNTTGHLNHWSTRGVTKFVEKHFGAVIARKTPLPWALVLAKKIKK
jgi:ubiquinone/menaquinone biosynthesis C-methylase UbiE